MEQQPKLLIVSNECISNVSSNGRTLRNFLIGWPKDSIAQFCIRSTEPDYTVCERFFYVSDRDALDALIKGKKITGQMPKTKGVAQKGGTGGRNPLTMLIRNMVWNSMRWAGTDFENWVKDFSPEIVLLQAGDCAFMFNIARKISKKYNIPLVIYNSEAYYFKKFDYFRSVGIKKAFYPLFHKQFCRAFEKCISIAKKSIYCCDELREDYDKCFNLPSEVIYTATQTELGKYDSRDSLRVVYLGNLGVGRHQGLVEIGEALQNISPDLKLQIYGKIPNQMVQEAFDECPGIDYKGFVSYQQVVEIMHTSDILIHTENFDDFYKEDLKYAFSTKIADCLASGACFLLYAPENLACTKYLNKNKAAWVVSKKEDLQPVFENLVADKQERSKYIENALSVVAENHNSDKNRSRFQQILCEYLEEC